MAVANPIIRKKEPNSSSGQEIPGFSSINADQIISTCQSSPDRQLSDVMGSGGSTTAQ